jgi:hypothetical protein
MEKEGIVERKVYAQRPVLVEYALTEKGAALGPALKALEAWADEWIPLDEGAHSQAAAEHQLRPAGSPGLLGALAGQGHLSRFQASTSGYLVTLRC